MKAYKGFNKDGTCRGFHFSEGETYHEDEAKLCESGFHACESPLDCFKHYPPGRSEYREVELSDVSPERNIDDSKVCAKTIKIGAKLDVAKICRLQSDFVKEHTTAEYTDEKAATAGDYGAATAGNRGAATAGYCGAATAGYCGAATAGNRGAATSKGSSAVGYDGVAVVRGTGCKVKGGLGALLVVAEENKDNFSIAAWKAAVVDGENIKPDTWYILKNGEFVEADEE